MERRVNLIIAVEEFGTEKQKKCVAEKKKWRKESNNNLIKTMKQYYRIVEEEGKGYKKIFVLKEPYEFEMPREDRRKGNGNTRPYEYELNSLLLDFILKNCKNDFVSMSLNKWLTDMKIIGYNLNKALYDESLRVYHFKELEEQYENQLSKKDIIILKHFLDVELKRIKSSLESTFRKLAETKIITYKVETYGCTLNKQYRALTEIELSKVANIKRDLCEKHEVTLKELTYKDKNPSVIAYKEDYTEELEKIGFKYTYDSHGCIVQVSDNMIADYIDKLSEKDELVISYGLTEMNIDIMVNDFKKRFAERSLELADGRSKKNNKSDDNYIKQSKAFGEYVSLWEKFLVFYDLTNYTELKFV